MNTTHTHRHKPRKPFRFARFTRKGELYELVVDAALFSTSTAMPHETFLVGELARRAGELFQVTSFQASPTVEHHRGLTARSSGRWSAHRKT